MSFRLKLFLSAMYLFLAFNSADAQELELTIKSSSVNENDAINSIGYSKTHKNYVALKLQMDSFKNRAQKLGYIEVKVQDITKTTLTVNVLLSLGPKYKSIQIYASKALFELLELTPKQDENKKVYYLSDIQRLESLLNSITNLLASKSYPFATVSLKNIKPFDNITLKADLSLDTKQARQLNTVEIKGYEKFPRSFITHFLGIKTNTPFNLKAIQAKTKTLDQISFSEQLRPAEVLFTKDTTSVYLYLKKNKSNQFEGFLGFGSKQTTGNLELNGYINLNLVNNLNYGESFILNYRNDENDLKKFNTKLTLPYLFRSRIGSELKLSLFKKDSTFTTAEQSANLYYQLNQRQKLFLGVKTAQSNALNPVESSTVIDYRTTSYELRGSYLNRTPKELLFPVKSEIEIQLSRARRKTTVSKINQNFYSIKAAHLFNFNTTNSLYINLTGQMIDSKNYLSNELLRFGGIKTIRGFEENSINANTFGVIASEYRLRLSSTLYIHSIIDVAYFNTPIKQDQKLAGIGIGFGLKTEAGILKFNLANGQIENQKFKFANSKVHLSLTATF